MIRRRTDAPACAMTTIYTLRQARGMDKFFPTNPGSFPKRNVSVTVKYIQSYAVKCIIFGRKEVILMLMDETAMQQWQLIQYMPDETMIDRFKKDKAVEKFFNSMNATYLKYIKRPASIYEPESLIAEIGKILITNELTHMQKCLAIGILLELGGLTKNNIRVDPIRKALGISNRGFEAKKTLEKKDLFRFNYLPDEKITEVEYIGTNPPGDVPVELDIEVEEPFFKLRRRYNV